MKAMVFAAGLGTRLRPLTDHKPKALIPVGGVPMLERVLLRLRAAGFRQVVVNIHHLGQQITDFLREKENFGMDICVSDERAQLLDTGGGIWHAREHLLGDDAPFLVHNADILTDIDLKALYDRHLESEADVTLYTADRKTSRYLLANAENRLCGWLNTQTNETIPADIVPTDARLTRRAFGGIHVLSPSVFRYMEQGKWQGAFPIIPFYLSICRTADIRCLDCPTHAWFDIGKPDALARAEAYIEEIGGEETS